MIKYYYNETPISAFVGETHIKRMKLLPTKEIFIVKAFNYFMTMIQQKD